MKLDVPYYSQFLDVVDKEWMPKSCAIVCLKMILDYYRKGEISLTDLIKKGYENGGYGPLGWYHDSIVSLAENFGLKARRVEKVDVKDGIKDISESLMNGNPVMISAIKRILGQTKFHVVVVTGFKERDGEVVGFYYNDPESTKKEKGQNIFTDINFFIDDWRRMAIFISP